MTKLKTITTIELSSLCNLSCSYCINRLIKFTNRSPGIMTNPVFYRSLELLSHLVSSNTQQEINLNGNGESLLDPDIFKRIKEVKDIMGCGKVQLSTNATLLTESNVEKLKETGIDEIHISLHDIAAVRLAVIRLHEAKIPFIINTGTFAYSHNWAGQLEEENSVPKKYLPIIDCDPLIEGRGYISSEGFISPCCYDYQLLGSFAHVEDYMDKILDTNYTDFSLCNTCHQKLPVKEKENVNFKPLDVRC